MPIHTGDWIGVCLAGGRYQVIEMLGEGGMGTVYRARDTNLDTDVVIKVPHPQMLRDSEFVARFAREIRSLVQLSHPHVVKILDLGQYEDIPFAVMQYLPGGSLEDRRVMRSPDHPSPMSPREIVAWLEDIATALDFIHSQHYVHRDVKPGNILFDAHGNVFISDFGVAKVIAQDAEGPRTSRLTGTGMVLGTPDYMAPEVVLGKPYDGRADQYALAVMLFELLCGRLPFVGPNPTSVLVAHSTQPVPNLREICPQVSPSLAGIVQRGLAKDPANRYPNCKALAAAFRAAIGQTGTRVVETVIRQHCPVCQQVLQISEKAAGQRVACRGCRTVLQISLDRQEIAVAGSTSAVYGLAPPPRPVAPSPPPVADTKAMRSPGTATAQRLPLPVPGTAPSLKWVIVGACAGSAVLLLLAVVVAALVVGRTSARSRSDVVAQAPTTAPMESKLTGGLPETGSGAAPAQQSAVDGANRPTESALAAKPPELSVKDREDPHPVVALPPQPEHQPPTDDVLKKASQELKRHSASQTPDNENTGGAEIVKDGAIRLPSGALFREETVTLDRDAMKRLMAGVKKEGSVLYVRGSTRFASAYAEYQDDRLEGMTVLRDREGQETHQATYASGKKEGWLVAADSAGRKIYSCQYRHGKRDGVACLFNEERLWMVVEFANGQRGGLVMLPTGKAPKSFKQAEEGKSDGDVGPALAQMDKLESQAEEATSEFERSFQQRLAENKSKSAKKGEEEERKARAAALSVQARENAQVRSAQRKAQEDANKRGQLRFHGLAP